MKVFYREETTNAPGNYSALTLVRVPRIQPAQGFVMNLQRTLIHFVKCFIGHG